MSATMTNVQADPSTLASIHDLDTIIANFGESTNLEKLNLVEHCVLEKIRRITLATSIYHSRKIEKKYFDPLRAHAKFKTVRRSLPQRVNKLNS